MTRSLNPLTTTHGGARSVDWPDLMATAERHGIPVMRTDEHGRPWILRRVADLAEWED